MAQEQIISLITVINALQQSVTLLLEIIGVAIAFLVALFAISRQARNDREKFASKEYVNKEIQMVDSKVVAIKEEQSYFKDDIKHIRSRLDTILDFHIKNSKK